MIKLKDMISRSLFVESKKLRVFDFDDTLVKTTSFIYITNGDKKTKLTPGQYAVYNEKPGDEFDFSDFQKVQDPQEIKKITKVFRRVVQSSGGDGVHILTARAAYKPIRQYLKDIGINMSKIYVTALSSNNPIITNSPLLNLKLCGRVTRNENRRSVKCVTDVTVCVFEAIFVNFWTL